MAPRSSPAFRVLPPLVVIGAGGVGRVLAPRELVSTVKVIIEGYGYARGEDDGDPAARIARIRAVMEQLLTTAAPDLPKGALDPFLDFLAAKITAG